MSGRPWDGLIPAEDLAIYERAGWGKPSGLGNKPALLVIDVQYRTTGTRPLPIADALDEFPTSCGERAWRTLDPIARLLGVFRAASLPVFYPHVAPKRTFNGGRFADKMPSVMGVASNGYDFVEAVAPRDGDVLVPKNYPSAFFGTNLISMLIDMGVDTIVATGCTTSGCVRGSVVDAFSYNLRSIVPEDCVYDRSETTHAVNLFDMSQKYADVVTSEQLLAELSTRFPGTGAPREDER